MNSQLGIIDILDHGYEGGKKFIEVRHRGDIQRVYLINLGLKSKLYNSEFLEGKETKKIFKDSENFNNSGKLSQLFIYIFSCVFESGVSLPVFGIDVDHVVSVCDSVEDLDRYFHFNGIGLSG